MEITESSGSRRPLEEGDESSSKRVRSLAGMLLCDEHTSDLSNEQHGQANNIDHKQRDDQHDQHDSTDHMQQPDTDIPGVWRCQVEPKSVCSVTELASYVYDWIDEASIPRGTKIETSRWCEDLKPRAGDETNVRSRVVVQQYNVVKRNEVHRGTTT